MHIDNNYDNLIKFVKQANAEIKILEHEFEQLAEPSIAQLRDCAYHMVKALESTSNEEYLKQIEKAEGHALRAKYDTYEIRIIFYLRGIKIFQELYNNKPETLEILPDYINMSSKVEDIKLNFQRNARDDSSTRNQYYENIQEDINSLVSIQNKLDSAVPFIVEKINLHKTQKIEENRKFIRNYSIAILGVIVAMVALLK